jgi:two-component system, NtrC family, sensor histidine kinase HydH
MESDVNRRAELFSLRFILSVWLPILAFSAAHLLTDPHLHWLHDVLRRAYYLPILFAAFQLGLLGGLAAVALVIVTYYPHAFLTAHHFDPASGIEKILEIGMYVVVGAVAGHLADKERARRDELTRALAEQRRLQHQLVRAGRLSALGEVVAGIAHEIKNPLHSLAGSAEIVDPLIAPELEERRLWEIHRSEIKRLERTAERFLSFARPGGLVEEELDLRDVARRAVDLIDAQARQQHVFLELALPDDPVRVRGDQDQLAQVALNIALNGLKAIGEGGGALRVSVCDEPQGAHRMACLRLENDGPRIPEAELEHLFDPFHSGTPDGTGLGLSISARVAEQHGGYIEAANEGLGVSFRVMLPSADGAEPS